MVRARTRVVRLLLVSTLVLGLWVVPAAPASAATATWSLSTTAATVKRDGVKYRMQMFVTESGDSESLTVQLSRSRNPRGVSRSTQVHSFTFALAGNRFSHRANLAAAAVDTASQLGTYGRVDVGFRRAARTRSSCRGHVKTRTGTLSGRLRLDTGTPEFGVIRTLPRRATLFFSDGKCTAGGGGGGGGSSPCPSATAGLSAFRFDTAPMNVFASRGRRSASVFVSWSETLEVANGSLSHLIIATLPARNVRLSADLSSGTIKGRRGTDLSGKAAWAANGPLTTSPPQACRGGRESVVSSRGGTLTGSLTARFFLGPDRRVGSDGMTGTAQRTLVRPG